MSALSTIPERRAAGSSGCPGEASGPTRATSRPSPRAARRCALQSGPSERPASTCSGSAVGERQPDTVAGPDREPPDQLVLRILGELVLAPHEQRIVAADRAVEAVAVAPDPRPDLAVVEPRARSGPRARPSPRTPSITRRIWRASVPNAVVARRRSSRAAWPRPRDRRAWSRARACRRGRSACTPTARRRSGRSSNGRRDRRSSSRPNALPESNRGRQHQSIDPSRETSAALWQSPISA